jgi:hypothetical protein
MNTYAGKSATMADTYAQLIVRRNCDGSFEVKYHHEGSTLEWRGTDIKAAVALATSRLAELFIGSVT